MWIVIKMSLRIRGVEFEEGPIKIRSWNPPYRAGVYAFITPGDSDKTWVFLYIGETGNLSERGFPASHHKYECCKKEAGSDEDLYVIIHLMPGSTSKDRREMETKLIHAGRGKPVCND
jgi:hypothetical protein